MGTTFTNDWPDCHKLSTDQAIQSAPRPARSQGQEVFLKPIICLFLFASPSFAQDYMTFQSPSGNIFCAITNGEYAEARCDMRELTPSFRARPDDCDLDWGDSFAVGETGPSGLVCHGDTVMDPDAVVLDYGVTTVSGNFSCYSAQSGVTCANADGHGFTISKARQELF
jgi:hypothetical protein